MDACGTLASGQSVLWHVSVSKRVVGKTPVACGTFFIKGPHVAVLDTINLVALLYNYPAGGNPIRTYSAPFQQPIGIVVSANVP